MSMDKRRKWFSVMLEEGLRLGVLSPDAVLEHVTPAVLATDLPPNLVAALLQAGIDGTAFNPALVLKTLGAEKVAEHVPLPLLWSCFEAAAAQIVKAHPPTEASSQTEGRTDAEVVEPGEVQPEDVPVIEVLEE